MNKKEFYDVLDGKGKSRDEESLQLTSLLEEVSQLDETDPGQDYWNNFNGRLQQRLDKTPARQPFWRLAGFPSWFMAAAAMALALFFLIPSDQMDSEGPPDFDSLESDQLSFLAGVYEEPDFYAGMEESDPLAIELADSDLEFLLNVYEGQDDLLEGFDADEFISLWETEG